MEINGLLLPGYLRFGLCRIAWDGVFFRNLVVKVLAVVFFFSLKIHYLLSAVSVGIEALEHEGFLVPKQCSASYKQSLFKKSW